ncbi:nucleotidyltransferase domain-containing protein [Bacillus sp. CGMCC 1.16607]|uniref:nucleotidyltransferase domain-containing protein n=1 Tax=Bacillus sp. CGMCC 1.16607 TaxID=3351842 RepID=UPI003641F58F
MDQINNQAQCHLNLLSELHTIFTSVQANFWLRGGWAIDFLLGRVTRTHSDIDLVTWVNHRIPLESALVEAGYKKQPVSELQTDFFKNDVDVSIVYLTRASDGRILANGITDWEWRSDALPTKLYTLNGIGSYVLSPQQLLEEKQVYENGTGRKPRQKDIESMRIIQSIIENLKTSQAETKEPDQKV